MDEEDDQYDYELVRFVFDLRKEDPLRMLVRAQAHIEHALRQFILANAAAPQHVEREKLDFDGIVRLAMILGLNAEIRPALTALSALQRKFVRSIDVEFGSPEADNFYSVLGPTLRDVLREVYEEFRVQENLIQFKRQPPSTRLVWFLIGIWAAILADRKHGPNRAFDTVELPVGYLEELDKRRIALIGLLDDGDDFQCRQGTQLLGARAKGVRPSCGNSTGCGEALCVPKT